MVSKRGLFLYLFILAIFATACSATPAGVESAGSQATALNPTTTLDLATPTTPPTETEDPPPTPSGTPESLLYCPDVIAKDTAYPDGVQITEVELDFEVVKKDASQGELFWIEEGFVVLKGGLVGYDRVEAFSEDGLNWVIFDFENRPKISDLNLDDIPPDRKSIRPGLGGKVELITGLGPSGLCTPGPDGVGKQFQLLPFGTGGEYQRPDLIGAAGDTIFLLVSYDDPPSFVLELGSARVRMEQGSDGIQMVDIDTGELLTFGPYDEGVRFVSIESGETLAEVSSEEFSDLMEASRRYQEATNLPPVFYLAWTRDRGLSWTTAKLPDQTPKRAFDVEGAVSPDGTVALLVYNTQNGQLFSPDEINGQLTEEEIQAARSARLFQEPDYLALRVFFPID